MTDKKVSKQIDVIREVTERASTSRKAAAQFLSNAGIISRPAQSGSFYRSQSATSKMEGWATRKTANKKTK